MTYQEFCQRIAKTADLPTAQAESWLKDLFGIIAAEISQGGSVKLDGLGTFLTVKTPSQEVEEDGQKKITLSEVEPDFEPDEELVKHVTQQIKENPELFAKEHPEEEEEEEEADEEAEKKLPDMPDPDNPKPDSPKLEDQPLAKASKIEFRDVGHLTIDKEILGLLPQQIARRYKIAPVDLQEGVLYLAMIDPEDFDALQVARKETGLIIKPILTTQEDINAVLDQYTGLQAELQEVIAHSDLGITKKEIVEASQEDLQNETNENTPTAKIVFSLVRRAVKEHASDIHIEPYEKKVLVRFRIDGILQSRVELPKEIQSAVISRLKIMATLKIDEQRLPQDGRFSLIIDQKKIDFRLSTIPVVFGETVVMRILDKSVGLLSLEDIGLLDRGLNILNTNIKRSHGMILVTGPTGSGKTTSLYAVLGKLMSDTVNIITLEDPVEYQIESINQSQVHTEIGYGFANGLRAIVRQDPDIVMLGEIRDQETADMAVHAALTGHIVLSTLHTNDAAGAFPRLIDMGVEPFLITSSVHTVIAQRLARIICPECKGKVEYPAQEMEEVRKEIAKMPKEIQEEFKGDKLHFYRGRGCDLCGRKGYRGRIGIYEVLDVTEPIRELVLKRSSGSVITEEGIKEGMITMVQDGIIKALRGMTTLEDVWRVTRE